MNATEYLKEKYALDLSKRIVEIPNVSRLDLVRWLRELDFRTGAEIGVFSGDYSKILCTINPQMQFWAIDAWLSYDGYNEMSEPAFLDNMYRQASFKLRNRNIHIIRETSISALNHFKDDSLDFVYIDANHESPFVDQDIEEWHKKVRPGGIVAGHDYIRVKNLNYTIIDVLDRHMKKYAIPNLFILGAGAKVPNVVRERVRSWAYVK